MVNAQSPILIILRPLHIADFRGRGRVELTGMLCNAALSGSQGASAQRAGFRVWGFGVLGAYTYTIISIERDQIGSYQGELGFQGLR